MSKVDEYIKKKSQKSKEWQKTFELEYKKLSDSLKKGHLIIQINQVKQITSKDCSAIFNIDSRISNR